MRLASGRLSFLLLLGILVTGNLLIFREFISGGRLLLFEDLGADSLTHNLPVMHYVSSVQPWGQYWMPTSVLGNNVFMLPWVNAFNPVLALLGWHTSLTEFAGRIVYYAAIQSLLAGVFFYWFLLRSGRSAFAAIAAASSYALCGAFTAVSTWMVMVTPPLLAGLAIVLWALRVWQQEGRFYLFSLAVAYFALTTQPLVTLYQLAVFLLLFIASETIAAGGGGARLSAFGARVARTALAGAVGVLAVAFFLLPHFYYTLFHTARRLGGAVPLLVPAKLAEAVAVLLRLYSNDLLGTASVWTVRYAYKNYFELPFLYCGFLLVLALPACFLLGGETMPVRRQRLGLATLLVPLALAQFLPGLRAYLFFAGQAGYFRWTSVFLVAALAIAGSRGLDLLARGEEEGRARRVVVGTAAVLLLGLFALSQVTRLVVRGFPFDPGVCAVVIAALLAYALLLGVARPALMRHGTLVVLLAELAYQGHHTVTFQREALAKADAGGRVGGSRLYSNPSMLEAIALVKRQEAGSFFRLSKTPEYGALLDNSSLCQDYRGTRGYMTFNNPATVDFYTERHLRSPDGDFSSYLPGFGGRHLLDTLVGVKYYLRQRSLAVPPWAERLTSIGRVEVFRNPRALPLGVLYDRYLLEREFRALPLGDEEKDLLLLSLAVVGEDTLPRALAGGAAVTHVKAPPPLPKDDVALRTLVEKQQRSGLAVESLGNDAIAGRVAADRPSLLFFSIPYDAGWHIEVDGAEVDRLRLQIGFLGALVPPGSHAIRLEYRPPYLRLGLAVSAMAVLAVIVALAFFRRTTAEMLSITPTDAA